MTTTTTPITIPGYTLERVLGKGGMAVVYLAVQTSLDRPVALKIMRQMEDPMFDQRFMNEGRTIASLNHHSIITIHDIGSVDGTIYIAMEYVEGGDLSQRISAGLTVDEILHILVKMSSCLHFVHQHNIIHRDVKPQNILFRADGAPVLTDFGIAKDTSTDQGLTLDGTFLGTPAYFSPEQAQGLALDGRSDIYSLGILFYEMLTKKTPYHGLSIAGMLLKHIQDPVPVLPDPWQSLQPLLDKMLAKNPQERFADANELAQFISRKMHSSAEQAQATDPKNNRTSPRYLGDLTVQVKAGPKWRRTCKIFDICVGGIFLLEQPGALPALAKLASGQKLAIHLPASNGAEAITLAGQVRRVSSRGVGVAFTSQSTALYTALQHIIAVLPSSKSMSAQGPDDVPTVANQEILKGCQDRLCNNLMEYFRPLMFEMPQGYGFGSAQNQDGLEEVPQSLEDCLKSSIASGFLAIQTKQPVVAKELEFSELGGQMTLMSEAETNEWVACVDAVQKAEDECSRSLYELEARLGLFAPEGILERAKNPASPAAISDFFVAMLDDMSLNAQERQRCLQIFHQQVMSRMAELYTTLNEYLVQEGVLPTIRYRVALIPDRTLRTPEKAPTEPPQQALSAKQAMQTKALVKEALSETALSSGVATPPAPALPVAQIALQPVIVPNLKDLFSVVNSIEKLAEQQPEKAASSAAAGCYTLHEILPVLSRLQEQTQSTGEAAPSNLAELIAQGAAVGPEQQTKALTPQHKALADQVAVLFEFIPLDPTISIAVKDLIGRLQIPALRVAMMSPDFLVSKTHPMRRLINVLAQAGASLTKSVGRGDPLFDRMEKIAEYASQNHDLDALYAEAEAFIHAYEKDLKQSAWRDQQIRQSKETRERLLTARTQALQALDQRLPEAGYAANVCLSLQHIWRQPLTRIYFYHGPDSAGWQKLLTLVDRLAEQGSEPQSQTKTDLLLERIREILAHNQYPAAKLQQFIAALASVLSKAEQKDSGRDESAARTLRMAIMPPRQADEAPPEVGGKGLSRAKRLQVGDWIEYYRAGQHFRAKLAWMSKQGQGYTFTDRQGQKVLEVRQAELAKLLEEPTSVLLESAEMPLLDRALYAKMSKVAVDLSRQAYTDPLTGLLDRSGMLKHLLHAIESARSEGTAHALFYFDLYEFSLVNERRGRDFGDKVLKKAAFLIGKGCNSDDMLARVGNDEFALLLRYRVPSEVVADLRKQMTKINHLFEQAKVGANIGVVLVTNQSEGAEQALQAAQETCALARTKGCNRVSVQTPNQADVEVRRADQHWNKILNNALAQNQFELWYQPILPLGEQQPAIKRSEILLTLRNEEGVLVPPREFLPPAKRQQRLSEIDRWVVRTLMAWLAEQKESEDGVEEWSIKLSAQTLVDPKFVAFVRAEQAKYEVSPSRICFEIPERGASLYFDQSLLVAHELKQAGYRLALDDFSSAAASYIFLRRLPVDYVRISGLFVRRLDKDPTDLAIMKSIQKISTFLGRKTIAKYVANMAILDKLREIEINFAQGREVAAPCLLQS